MNKQKIIRHIIKRLEKQNLPIASISIVDKQGENNGTTTFHSITNKAYLRLDWSAAPGVAELQKIQRVLNNIDWENLTNQSTPLSAEVIAATIQALPDKTKMQLFSRFLGEMVAANPALGEAIGIETEATQ